MFPLIRKVVRHASILGFCGTCPPAGRDGRDVVLEGQHDPPFHPERGSYQRGDAKDRGGEPRVFLRGGEQADQEPLFDDRTPVDGQSCGAGI